MNLHPEEDTTLNREQQAFFGQSRVSLKETETLTYQERLEEVRTVRLAGDFSRALQLLNNLQTTVAPNQRSADRISYLNELSECLRCLGQYDEAIIWAQKALQLAEETSDLLGQGYALNNLGAIHKRRGELDQAEEFFLQSLAISRKLENLRQIATALTNLGELYRQRGELTQAEKWCQQSLLIREQIGNPQELAVSRYQLMRIFLMRRRFADAASQVGQLEQLAQTSKLEDVVARHHLATGMLKFQQGDLRDALNLGWQARSQAEQIPNFGLTIETTEFLVFCLLQLYLFAEENVHLTWCEALLKELERFSKRERLYGTYAESLLIQGLLKRATFDVKEATGFFHRAEILAGERGLQLIAQQARSELAKLQKQIDKLQQFQKMSPELYEQIQVQEVLGYIQQVRTVVG
ncbi:MAG: tetratricopeptide repeat protein [Candidatus Thorarchaeota archaeon]